MKLLHTICASTLALGLIATPLAQAAGWYAGINVGRSSFDIPGGIGVDDKDTSFSILGGYNVNENFGIEAAYTDLGKISDSTDNIEFDGFEIAGVGSLPLEGGFSLFGKVGFIKWDGDDSAGGSVDGTDLLFGFGAAYKINEQFSVGGSWTRYNLEDDGDDLDTDVLGVAGIFSF